MAVLSQLQCIAISFYQVFTSFGEVGGNDVLFVLFSLFGNSLSYLFNFRVVQLLTIQTMVLKDFLRVS